MLKRKVNLDLIKSLKRKYNVTNDDLGVVLGLSSSYVQKKVNRIETNGYEAKFYEPEIELLITFFNHKGEKLTKEDFYDYVDFLEDDEKTEEPNEEKLLFANTNETNVIAIEIQEFIEAQKLRTDMTYTHLLKVYELALMAQQHTEVEA